MNEFLIRFLLGGAIVSIFSSLGDLFRPKSFAGLFGAAPSVALATLALTISKQGTAVAATECRSMIFGAAALGLYSLVVCQLLIKKQWSALAATSATTLVWMAAAAVCHSVFG